MTAADLKQKAKDKLNGQFGYYISVFFTAAVIMVLSEFGLEKLTELIIRLNNNSFADTALRLLIPKCIMFISAPILLSLAIIFLNLVRNPQVKKGGIFDGFKNYNSAFLVSLLKSIFIFLWSLLLIIPGIIKSYAYSMSYYILADNPEMTALEAIRASNEMMKGHKASLFMLYFSFIGWYLLLTLVSIIGAFAQSTAIIIIGYIIMLIGICPLLTWIQASVAEFYQDILDRNADTTM